MHEPALVRCVESGRDLSGQEDGPLLGERAVAEQGLQVRALDVAHGDEQAAVGLARLVDRDHVGVVERGGQLRLAQEPVAEALVLCERRREELQRHSALQAQILRQVDDAHPAPAQDRLDPVVGDLRAAFPVTNLHWLSLRFLAKELGRGSSRAGGGIGTLPRHDCHSGRAGGSGLELGERQRHDRLRVAPRRRAHRGQDLTPSSGRAEPAAARTRSRAHPPRTARASTP